MKKEAPRTLAGITGRDDYGGMAWCCARISTCGGIGFDSRHLHTRTNPRKGYHKCAPYQIQIEGLPASSGLAVFHYPGRPTEAA